MRQLKEQIDILLKESADRKRMRQPDSGSSQVNKFSPAFFLTNPKKKILYQFEENGVFSQGYNFFSLQANPGSVKKKEHLTPAPASRPVTPALTTIQDTPKGRGRGRGTATGPPATKRAKKVPVLRGRPPPVPGPPPAPLPGSIAEGIKTV